MPALPAIGALYALVFALWGSFGAMQLLYPLYEAAFITPETAPAPEPRAVASLGVHDPRAIIEAAMRPEASGQGVKAAPDISSIDASLVEPAKTVEPAVEPDVSVEAFARLSQEDAPLRSGASVLAPALPRTAPDMVEPEVAAVAPDAAPEVAPEAGPIDLQVATADTIRPMPRPFEAEAPAAPQVVAARVDARADARAEDGTTIISSMSSATELAVASSLRPRTVPGDLRRAALALFSRPAPQKVQDEAEEQVTLASLSPNVEVKADPEPAIKPVTRISGNGCGRNHARNMPSRRGNAPGGQAFITSLGNGSGGGRDNAIIKELARGNMPGFLKQMQPVVLRGKDASGANAEIVVCVTPDYLALGSDRDFVRVPLGLPAASSIAGQFGMMLPTSRMVDAIYAQAPVKLSPQPMQAGPQMSSTSYFLRHNATIEGQRRGRSGLIAGHKKDVVVASRMASNPGRVAIYGWHRSNGNPIQPVSTVHGASYADYSHGIRLVSRTAYLNGRAVDLGELLSSRRYAGLLNSDGPLPAPVIRIASR